MAPHRSIVRGLIALLLLSTTACGGDSPVSPVDASQEDFCRAYVLASDSVDALLAASADDQWSTVKETYEDLADVGTPAGISDEERAGFEVLIDTMTSLAEDQASGGGTGTGRPEPSAKDQASFDAFMVYAIETCSSGGSPDLTESVPRQ
jgi:hypothetical protein